MVEDMLKKGITITEAVNDGTKVKITDQDGIKYTFFVKKQDGSDSMAYSFWKGLEKNGVGTGAIIGYKETQGEFKGNKVTYRNIMVMNFGPKQSLSQTVAQVKQVEVNKDAEQEKWDKIAIGKVRHGFALEAFKMTMPLDSVTKKIVDDWTNYVMTGDIAIKQSSLPTIQIEDEWNIEEKVSEMPIF